MHLSPYLDAEDGDDEDYDREDDHLIHSSHSIHVGVPF